MWGHIGADPVSGHNVDLNDYAYYLFNLWVAMAKRSWKISHLKNLVRCSTCPLSHATANARCPHECHTHHSSTIKGDSGYTYPQHMDLTYRCWAAKVLSFSNPCISPIESYLGLTKLPNLRNGLPESSHSLERPSSKLEPSILTRDGSDSPHPLPMARVLGV